MFTVLWCYLRNSAFKTKETDYHLSADLTGQANHLGVTIEADIIKQKLPENNGGYTALNCGRRTRRYRSSHRTIRSISHAISLRTAALGRAGLINSGGASAGETVEGPVGARSPANKRAGGMV